MTCDKIIGATTALNPPPTLLTTPAAWRRLGMADNDSRTIELNHGHVLIVDVRDYDVALAYRWQTQPGKCGTFYVWRPVRDGVQTRKEYLHRRLMGAVKGQRVDHINGNGLDNRRSNLRACSNADNMRNMRVRPRGSSRFKGVSWFRRHQLWRAYIVQDAKQIHLGYFSDEADAAKAYDAAARRLFGEFANTNFPVGA